MKKDAKKKTKRSYVKYPAFHPELNPRIRYELVDYDYLDKLSEEEKQWLHDFTQEYTHANFNHNGKRKHKTKKQKKDCYDRNNARNRCMWSRAKAAGLVVDSGVIESSVADLDEEETSD